MSKAPAKQPSSADNLGKAASKSKTDPTEPPPSKSSGSTSEKVSKQAAQTSKPNQPAAPAVDAPYNGNLSDGQWYLSRELSWLEFNRRVLHEATDERTPLLERLKFLSIFSSNLDEYFMVRVAATKQQIEANVSKRTPDGRTPSEQLEAISQHLRPMFTQVHSYFQTQLKPNLLKHGIYLLNYEDLAPTQTDYLDQYFNEQIFPVLTPLAVDPGHPFPYISNLSLNLAVEVQEQNSEDSHFARVKVPKVLPRFVELPDALQKDNQAHGPESSKAVSPCQWMGVPMEQVIAHNIEALFPGMSVKNCSVFRITRNADLSVEEDEADDLMLAIEQELRKRRLGGSVVRMESEAGMNEDMRRTLMNELNLLERDVYDVEGFIGLTDMMSFMSLPLNTLKDSSWKPVTPAPWKAVRQGDSEDVFSLIRRRDRLVHHPYQAFSGTVQTFITQAAIDPDVLAIKMTLYRTSGDSPIVNALIKAAEHGKQVVALVELKARFDEENNINWARTLERSGVHVVYGLMGLKTHTKIALVVRRENRSIRRYVHIGTGNYNPKTARLYTDLGLLSCREELGTDLTDLFNYLTGYSRQQSYKKLLIAPVSLRKQMTDYIRAEARLANSGKKGRIIAKMNALVDHDMIMELYKASQAGVEIDLIIRGICCLRPGIEGLSENIRVISIIGRFLEHSRIFHFHNDGKERFYIGSADWMPRNLDRRVEAVVPIEDPPLRSELAALLEICLNDNRQAWEMQADGSYLQRSPKEDEPIQSTHEILMKKALSQS
ncbi:MAG: polyphosphate kinase 1 [Cyanobacteria bacterium J06606_4]